LVYWHNSTSHNHGARLPTRALLFNVIKGIRRETRHSSKSSISAFSMKLKDLIKAPPAEGYIKNSSNLVTALFILAGILYYPTNGYGSVIALAAALIVLVGQKMLIGQTKEEERH
jgi:hypothetical protein